MSGLHGARAPCSGPHLPATEPERRSERSPYTRPAPTPVTPARAEGGYLQGRGSCETKATRVWALRAPPEVSLPDASWCAVAGARIICSRCRQRARAQQSRQCVRAVKEMDSKSIGLCPQGFESPRCRILALHYGAVAATPDHVGFATSARCLAISRVCYYICLLRPCDMGCCHRCVRSWTFPGLLAARP